MSEKETVGRDELIENEMEDSDFGFIITAEGELKVVLMPLDQAFEIPSNVRKLFKLFGIKAPESVVPHSIH